MKGTIAVHTSLMVITTGFLLSGMFLSIAYGAGNYCDSANRILWTSNRDSPSPLSGPAVETFNIFIMDSSGGHRSRLTTDSWPVINQHPVFTPTCQRVVWARGSTGHSSIWIMNLDGSAKAQVTSPPEGEEDGHPWAGLDGRLYFVRSRHPSHVHTLWRMNLNGSGQTELVGGDDQDRFHPNLRRDKKLVLYTSGSPGSGQGVEIRVFNQETKQDSVLYKPGWPVSAAIWHPNGDRAGVAEDHDGNGRYRIVEIGYPGGALIRTLTDDKQDNTIPYYAYPSGASIDWVQWSGGRRTRNIARMKADGSGQTLLTNDAYENTKIVGELEITPPTSITGSREQCKPRPVGCYPTPPPCERVLLPDAIKANVEQLGRATGRADKTRGAGRQIASESYLEFMRADLNVYIERSQPHARQELQQGAVTLQKFLSINADSDIQERVADLYGNSYLSELNRLARTKR